MPDDRGTGRNRLQRNRVASADHRRANVKPEDTRDPVKNPGQDEAYSAQPIRPNLLNGVRGRGRAVHENTLPYDMNHNQSGKSEWTGPKTASDIDTKRSKAVRDAIRNIGKKG